MRVSFRRMAGFLLIGLLIELAFFAGMMLGPQLVGVIRGQPVSSGHAPLLDEAWDIAQDQFYGAVPSDQARTYGAVRGMLESFNDPYTVCHHPASFNLDSGNIVFWPYKRKNRQVACGSKSNVFHHIS